MCGRPLFATLSVQSSLVELRTFVKTHGLCRDGKPLKARSKADLYAHIDAVWRRDVEASFEPSVGGVRCVSDDAAVGAEPPPSHDVPPNLSTHDGSRRTQRRRWRHAPVQLARIDDILYPPKSRDATVGVEPDAHLRRRTMMWQWTPHAQSPLRAPTTSMLDGRRMEVGRDIRPPWVHRGMVLRTSSSSPSSPHVGGVGHAVGIHRNVPQSRPAVSVLTAST